MTARADRFGAFPGEISPMSIGEKSAEVVVAKKPRNGNGAKDRRSFDIFNKLSAHERVET